MIYIREIEVKILEIDKENIIDKIKSLGGEKIFDDMIVAQYFKFDDGTLRVRKEGNKVILCHKEKSQRKLAKSTIETEVVVDSFDNTVALLEKLGFHKLFRHKKHRTSFSLSLNIEHELVKARIDIDEFIDVSIPTFMEIESDSEENILRIARKLGYDGGDLLNWNSSMLAEHYGVSFLRD